ncbi:hypothetical protein EKO27_g1129 [Xylaria grammica]|uniref:Methyltransferase domain-containing protein n=1 Tax=Xylaria grammica TaxID=363999 RepID=A0A439DHS0_9PEZI|nr:hypothetical protein EKO27_g1129 [Xylaria grammica]
MNTIITPRFHLLEIGDQSWCPEFLREYSHLARMQMWRMDGKGKGGERSTPAEFACDVMLDNIPDLANFTLVDPCAGGGGPIPILEPALNRKLHDRGHKAVRFVLSDLWPSLERWASIAKRSENITYIAEPRDATKSTRLAEPGKKECRLYNLCFHHFDDQAAELVLRSAIESSDAFVIFEMTNRTLTAFLNTTCIVLSPFLTALIWFRNSPIHLFFTYIIPLVPLMFAVDGYVSCIRGRTNSELETLLRRQKDLDLNGWEFKGGETTVLPPFGVMYWYVGIKKTQGNRN